MTSPSAVDVIRASNYPSGRVSVDGREADKRAVAPGFLVTRVPAGTHRIEAVVSPLRYHVPCVAAAFALCVLASISGRAWGRLVARLRP